GRPAPPDSIDRRKKNPQVLADGWFLAPLPNTSNQAGANRIETDQVRAGGRRLWEFRDWALLYGHLRANLVRIRRWSTPTTRFFKFGSKSASQSHVSLSLWRPLFTYAV